MAQNKHILKQIVCAISFLGKQGLPFCGDKGDVTPSRNPGNFLALLKDNVEVDEILLNHLYHPKAKKCHLHIPYIIKYYHKCYNSSKLIIIRAVKKRLNFFSVLADEVSSHNSEHLLTCLNL